MDNVLIIIRGIPGCGKSSFAKLIGKAICVADDYHIDLNRNYNWKLENQGKAHEWCQRKCEKFMQRNIDKVIVANTSTTEKEITPYLNLANKYNYKVYSIIVENRHGNVNIHNVPQETLDKMESRFSIKLK